MKILVVEDSENVRQSLVKLLSRVFENIEIDEAENISQGKEQLSKSIHDLIILDLNLPDGSGINLITQAKAISNSKVIVFSSTASEFIRKRALSLGADHFIDKTFEFEKLMNTLENLQPSS